MKRHWHSPEVCICVLIFSSVTNAADLISVTPGDDQTVGSATPELLIDFSAPVDPLTATSDSIRIYRLGNDPLTPGPDDVPVVIAAITPEIGNTQLRITTANLLTDGRYAWVIYGTASNRSGPGHGLYFSRHVARMDVEAFKTLGEEFTFEAWTRFDDWASYGSHTYGAVFDVGQTGRHVPGFGLSHQGEKIHFFFREADGRQATATALDALAKGEWRHLAGVSSPAGMKVYVDGQLATSIPDVFRPDSFADQIVVALSGYSRWAGAYDYVLGMFDELRVWNVARSEAEINATMHTPLAGTESGLLLYHPLDQTTGDVLIDATGNGYAGTRGGAPRRLSEAPLIEMSSVALLGGDSLPVDATGDGAPGGVLVSTFSIDTTPPRVVNVEPDLLSCPILVTAPSLTLKFDDEMAPASLVAADTFVLGSGGDGTFDDGNETFELLASPVYDPTASTATYTFDAALTDDTYRFTLQDSARSVAGTALDGEFPGLGGLIAPLPSGDGAAGGHFVIVFTVDSTQDCNDNGIPDECEPADDCNENGAPDICDIGAGASRDCNDNAVPDECDLAAGIGEDENGNGMLDACELVVDRVKPCGRMFITPSTYYPNEVADAIRAFDRSGNPKGVFLGGTIGAVGGNPVFDRQGNMIVPQSRKDKIIVVDRNGKLIQTISGGGADGTQGVAIDEAGNIAVGSYFTDSIKFFAADGTYLSNLRHAGTEDPKHVVYDRAGNLFVASRNNGNGRIAMFDTNRAFVRYVGQGLFQPDPTTLAFDRSENLYAATGGEILKFSHDGTFLDSMSHPELKPVGLAFDEAERLYATNWNAHEVFVFSTEGDLLDRLPVDFGPNPNGDVYLYGIAFEAFPDPDCNENGTGDACDIASRTSLDCQFNGVPDECELDSNDCNTNLIPDDCEPDCNSNGAADECDIASGTSDDCNTNNVPDECEWIGGGAIPPHGAILNPENGSYYLLAPAMTWPDAEAFAVSLNGDLATISDQAENQWLLDAFFDLTASNRIWIGFNDLDVEGAWEWSNDEFATYSNWFSTQPDDTNGEDCGELMLRTAGCCQAGTWNDNRCSASQPAIIEFAPVSDCNDNGALDECDIASNISNDCNTNDVPDECEFAGTVDCNGNGITDLCDPGGAEDCNRNDIPDGCDIRDATSDDCNDNGIPDDCDLIADQFALDFDGRDDWVRVPRSPLLEPTDELTIETWIRPDSIGSTNNSRIVRMASPFAPGYILSWRQSGTSKLELRISGADGLCFATDPTPVSDYFGKWIHVAAVYSNSQDLCQIYVDGVLKGSRPAVGTLRYSGSDLYFGNHVESGEDFDGLIDEVRIWEVARTQTQIADSLGVPLTGSPPGLVGYWRFDEGTGQTVFDASPNGFHGMLGGNADPAGDGRDPFWTSPGAPIQGNDCNQDGTLDECDIAGGTSDDCNANETPDECEADDDCNTNGVQDICDLADGTSDDCNQTAVPDECELVDNDCNENLIPDDCEDCNGNGLADECDIADGTSHDCNINAVPDECEPDCNTNDVADECDIAAGASYDFDVNGVPDECQPDCNDNGFPDFLDIAFGAASDCNGNAIPDACDLVAATSADCNVNEVPDECDIAAFVSDDCDGDATPDECESDKDLDGIPDDCDRIGDYDHDADVDLTDYEIFELCLFVSGPLEPPPFEVCLDRFDADGSSTIDLFDAAYLQAVFTD